MKKRRKHKACLNCGELLQQKHNYCPNCGQENTDHQVSIGLLMREFTSIFFSLDSRFAHTFKPFLFDPGKITNAFIAGRRVYYANPIRWYLVISILHFFLLSKVFQPTVHDKKQRGFSNTDPITQTEYDSLQSLPDSVHLNKWPQSGSKFKMADYLIQETDFTADEIMDSLEMNTGKWTTDFITKKIVRTKQETNASITNYLMRQIPIIVFFILPIYAFLLKLFFWRKGLYIKHLIHSIHIHSFFFFLLSIVWIFELIFEGFEDFGINISLLIMTVYILISIKKVYGVRIRWGIVRLFFLGILYIFLIGIALVVGVLLSLACI